jgi:hypothetical protein
VCRLKWQPVVFTIVNLSKAEKQSKDPLSAYRAQLEPFDIKFAKEYVSGQTTHVVALKRNVAPALEALLQGRYVVTKEYVDAVVKAATEETSPSGGGEPKAPLERDFEKYWPDAMNFVPAIANEPVPRDENYLAPDPKRAEVFYGYTFVFCMKAQFDSLQPVINAGSGKARLFESFEEGKSEPLDFVKFVKNVAGDKGAGELDHSTRSKGVVVVRITTKDGGWGTHFIQETDRALDQRSIEQNELLDVILTLNTTGLRQKLAEEIDLTSSSRRTAPPSTKQTPAPRPANTSTVQPKSEPSTQVTRKAKTEGRFKGFFDDDDDDDEAAPAVAPSAVTRSLPQGREDVTMDDAEDLPASAPSRATRLQAQPNAPKRPTPEPSNGDIMDELLPAQAAMKRRKLNQAESVRPKTPESEKKPIKKPKREIDHLAEAQKRRQEADARARAEAEDLKAAMNEMDIQGPANLVEIEEMQLSRSHSASASRTSAATSTRWDERWNDRPNFKRFRRKGEAQTARPRQRNFVHMEETKRRDFGVGEEYWLEAPGKGKQRSQRESQVQMQTQTQTQTLREPAAKDGEVDEDDDTQFHRRPRATKTSRTVAEEEDDDAEVVEETLRTARSRSQSIAGATQTQTQPTTRKRVARDPPAREPPAKKKATQSWKQKAMSEDEDEDDELAFPRRGGRRR